MQLLIFFLVFVFSTSAFNPEESKAVGSRRSVYGSQLAGKLISSKVTRQYGQSQVASNKFSPVVCPPNNPAWNKLIALQVERDYCDLNPSNFAAYIAPDYIEHDTNTPDGLRVEIESISPGGVVYNEVGGKPLTLNFFHVSAIGDYVWIHSTFGPSNGTLNLALGLWRFECGKIKEHWLVMQPIDPNQPVYNRHPYV